MLDPGQLKQYVIYPALDLLSPTMRATEDAARLLLGTALQESELRWLDQRDAAERPGPAYGLWQIERATFQDLIARTPALLKSSVSHIQLTGRVEELHWNLLLGAVLCRMKYYLCPERVPSTALEAAQLWKLRYNTPLGAGTLEKALPKFEMAWAL